MKAAKERKLWGAFWYGIFLKDDLGSVGFPGCSRALSPRVLATCIICFISKCVFCPTSLQDTLFNDNYFFSLLWWLSNSLEGGAHGFSFPSEAWASGHIPYIPSFSILPPRARCPPPLLSSGTKHAATGTLERSDLVLQMFRCVLGCGSSGFLREGSTPREESEGATLVDISLGKDKGVLYLQWYQQSCNCSHFVFLVQSPAFIAPQIPIRDFPFPFTPSAVSREQSGFLGFQMNFFLRGLSGSLSASVLPLGDSQASTVLLSMDLWEGNVSSWRTTAQCWLTFLAASAPQVSFHCWGEW